MNVKTLKSTVLLLVLALIGSMFLSAHLARRRAPLIVRSPRDTPLVRTGFNKVMSHLAWMRLIQLRGGMDKVTPQQAEILAKKYESLTDMDPLFLQAYEQGALDIAWENPESALRLLDKAISMKQVRSWKLPFIAGFLVKTRLNDSQRAIHYLDMAARLPDRPSYVQRLAINAKTDATGHDPVRTLNLWVDYYTGGPGELGEMGRRGTFMSGPSGENDADRKIALTQISRLSSKIIESAQKQLQTERDPAAKKLLQERMDQTRKTTSLIYGNAHICPKCFRPYQAADRFCVYDGVKVDPFNVCSRCQGTVGRGTYCPMCGSQQK
jgi:hypothetical protein